MKDDNMNIPLGKMLDTLIEDRVEVILGNLSTNNEYLRAEESKTCLLYRVKELLRQSDIIEEMSVRTLMLDLETALMELSFKELSTAYLQGIKDCQTTNAILFSLVEQTAGVNGND